MTRKRAGLGIGAMVLAVGALGLGSQVIGPLAVDTCVTNYEDANLAGDSLAVCDTNPNNVKIANLTQYTTGLHNGCNRIINQSSTWNDCISSARTANLGSTRRVRFYGDIQYGGSVLYCVDTAGNATTNFGGGNAERISSFRNESGNC